MAKPVPTIVIYHPVAGRAHELEALIKKHGPALQASGLITAAPVRAWRAVDKRSKGAFFVEILEWRDEMASDTAHQTPEIMAVWEPMGPCLESMTIAKLTPISGAM